MFIIGNTEKEGRELARELKGDFVPITEKKYPDGEKSLIVKAKRAHVILYTFNKKETFDEQLLNILALLSQCGSPVYTRLVLPYFPYLRSCPFPKNEIDKVKFLVKEFGKYTKETYIICPHIAIEKIQKYTQSKKINEINIDQEIIAGIKKISKSVVLVAPDQGFAQTIKRLALKMKIDYLVLDKQRISSNNVKISGNQLTGLKVKKYLGRHFVFIDDIVSTGATLVQGTKYLRSLGAKHIHHIAVHDTSWGGGKRAFLVQSTNSLTRERTQVYIDIIPSIARAISI